MPITRERENLLRLELIKFINLPISGYMSIEKLSHKYSEVEVKKIKELTKLMDQMHHHAVEVAVSNFALAPLGKDLRRNIAYMSILKDIKDVMKAVNSIAAYIEENSNKSYDFLWMSKISKIIIQNLTDVKKLIENEDTKLASKIIDTDKKINDEYKKIISAYLNIEKLNPDIKTEEKNRIIAGFVLTSKKFEITGDNIKSIAEQIIFVHTGKL